MSFQHTAARRRLEISEITYLADYLFQHTAARRRLVQLLDLTFKSTSGFQHTAARRRLGHDLVTHWAVSAVSTHSRPKAAGCKAILTFPVLSSFNTQPPEGGWFLLLDNGIWDSEFQHTAARRRLARTV